MDDKRAGQTSERATFSHCILSLHSFLNCSIKKMVSPSNDSQLQFVLQTFERDSQLSIRKFTRFYNIPHIILSIRINSRSIYADIIANLRKLTVLKEEVVIQEVFDLDS